MIQTMLKNVDIFNDLGNKEFQNIAAMTTLKTLNEGNVLFYEGEDPKAFYILLQGRLKLYKTGIKSQEIILHHFIKPTMVAEMPSLENMKFPATSVATIDDTVVAVIEREKFIDILKSDAELSFHIIKSLTKKMKGLEMSINRNLIFDASTKVCSILKENPEVFQVNKNIEVANLLNMAPETLSRTIAKLKKLQILDERNRLTDIKKLDMFLEF